MTIYAYVENNEIKEIFYFKPKSWKNISNFDLIPENELINYNWYIVIDSPAEYDDQIQEIFDIEYHFVNNQVLRVYLIRDKLVEIINSSTFDTIDTSTETTTSTTVVDTVDTATEITTSTTVIDTSSEIV